VGGERKYRIITHNRNGVLSPLLAPPKIGFAIASNRYGSEFWEKELFVKSTLEKGTAAILPLLPGYCEYTKRCLKIH